MYLCVYKFLKQVFFKSEFNKIFLSKTINKKNLFFKRKFNIQALVSKRLSIVLRKRKRLKKFKNKKVDKGNFFFKKFFYKTLLKARKNVRSFFFFNIKTRQKKITKHIFFKSKFIGSSGLYEYSILNVLLRCHFCLCVSDALNFLKNRYVFINGGVVTQHDYNIFEYDLLQLKLTKSVYRFLLFSKSFLKKKLSLFRIYSWQFFKQKFFKQQQQLKPAKRRTPKYLYMFYVFRFNTPRHFEVDYLTLSVCVLKSFFETNQTSYYFNKLFPKKLFSFYNFKKLN